MITGYLPILCSEITVSEEHLPPLEDAEALDRADEDTWRDLDMDAMTEEIRNAGDSVVPAR